MASEDRGEDVLRSAEIATLLAAADEINKRIGDLLSGKYSDEARVVILLGYLNLALDHHQSILLLVRNRRFCTALALVRVVYELTMRAGWAATCASSDDLKSIRENEQFRFMPMKDIAIALDKATSKEVEESVTVYRETYAEGWDRLNSYTHSGNIQLVRQFRGERVQANYTPTEIGDCLRNATSCLIQLAAEVAEEVANPWQTAAIIELFDLVPDP